MCRDGSLRDPSVWLAAAGVFVFVLVVGGAFVAGCVALGIGVEAGELP